MILSPEQTFGIQRDFVRVTPSCKKLHTLRTSSRSADSYNNDTRRSQRTLRNGQGCAECDARRCGWAGPGSAGVLQDDQGRSARDRVAVAA